MQALLVFLLWLVLLYLAALATVLMVSMWILRQKLRKYEQNGRFGY